MITSKDNPAVKLVSKLMSSSKARREEGLFTAEGVRLCREAVLSGARISYYLYTGEAAEKYSGDHKLISSAAEKSIEVSKQLFERLADTNAPQGFLCVISSSGLPKLENVVPGKRYAAFETIQDPSNLGTVLRTAEALGINGVVLSKGCCDVFSPKVVRGSMGAVFRMPVMNVGEMKEFVLSAKAGGIKCYASTPRAEQDISKTDFSGGGIMLIGNEGSGLTDEVIDACDVRVGINMLGRAESLNASAAAAILMYEMCRGG